MDAVERQITLPASPTDVWELLTQPAELATWLGDEVDLEAVPGATGGVVERDGTRRSLVVDDVEPGQRLSWHWWPDDDPTASPSRVEITLQPTEDGTTVHVVEHLVASATIGDRARASEAWSHRLLHLEALLLVAAAVRG